MDDAYLVIFTLDAQRFGIKLAAVERVVRAVAITALPQAPELVSGVINFKGSLVPVLNIRKRLGLPGKDLDVTDQMIIARTKGHTVGLVVDAVSEVRPYTTEEFVEGNDLVPGLAYVEGILKLYDGVLLVQDVDRFLSLEETEKLDAALSANVPNA